MPVGFTKVLARIYLYKFSGRKTPFMSGYRPILTFGDDWGVSSQIELIDQDQFELGEQGEVYIYLIDEAFKNVPISVNSIFGFSEGTRYLGEGEILEILNNES